MSDSFKIISDLRGRLKTVIAIARNSHKNELIARMRIDDLEKQLAQTWQPLVGPMDEPVELKDERYNRRMCISGRVPIIGIYDNAEGKFAIFMHDRKYAFCVRVTKEETE